MAPGPYLIRRGAALFFRRRVPKTCANHFRSTFLQIPLRTHLLAEGRRKALRASAFAEDAFAVLEAGMGISELNEATIERIVLSLMRFELDAREALRALAPPRGTAEIEATLRLEAATRETLRAALIYNDYTAVRTPVDATLGRLGIAVSPDSLAWRTLARGAARALIEVSDENARREAGVYSGSMLSLLDPMTGARAAELRALPPMPAGQSVFPEAPPSVPVPARASAPIADAPSLERVAEVSKSGPAPSVSKSPGVDSASSAAPEPAGAERRPRDRAPVTPLNSEEFGDGPLLLDAGEQYIAEMIEQKGESWEVNSAGNHRSTFRLLAEVHGNRPFGFYTKERLREFTGILRGMPKHHHKGHTGAPIRELIEQFDAKDEAKLMILKAKLEASGADRGTIETTLAAERGKRVKIATVYRHQQEAQRLFVWGADRGLAPANLMKGVIWTGKQLEAYKREESDGKRLPWGDKAKLLFSSQIYVDALEDPCDPLFWAPLIAYFAGLRQEEALQLKTDDFETIAEIACFRIQQGEDQHLKNQRARRLVPIHPDLIALGILELVERRRREGQAWLFPGLERSTARGRLSGLFTKVFTNYRIEQGLYDPLRPFHSLRADFNVEMKRAGVPLNQRKRLMGHAVTDVTDVDYDPEGDPLDVLFVGVCKIRFDTSGIRRPFAAAPGSSGVTPRLRLVN